MFRILCQSCSLIALKKKLILEGSSHQDMKKWHWAHIILNQNYKMCLFCKFWFMFSPWRHQSSASYLVPLPWAPYSQFHRLCKFCRNSSKCGSKNPFAPSFSRISNSPHLTILRFFVYFQIIKTSSEICPRLGFETEMGHE